MDLRDAAKDVQGRAYAPYSGFKVGAAIRAESGQIYQGCNVENVAYPEGTCAEAGAIAAMIAGADTVITEVYVIAGGPAPVAPCGGCRQKRVELGADDVRVTMATLDGQSQTVALRDLLPGAFGADQMGGD